MSDPNKRAKPSHYRTGHRFAVDHQQKQRLLLRALEQMDTSGETTEETRAVVQMITRLEELVGRRKRARVLTSSARRQPTGRKRCAYGTRPNQPA